MKKLLFLSYIMLTLNIQASEFKRTDGSSPKSNIGKRKRTPEPSTPQLKPCAPTINSPYLQLPENPSAPIKKHFLEKYKPMIEAFIAQTPDHLARHTCSIEHKPSVETIVSLTMRRGTANLHLTHRYLPKETQNLIEAAQLCDELKTMTVDDSILQISKK